MMYTLSPEAAEQLAKLPKQVQKKVHKQFSLLLINYRHPSLRARKMGDGNTFEARIDLHYRFTFIVDGENVYVLTIGMHDAGLGKK